MTDPLEQLDSQLRESGAKWRSSRTAPTGVDARLFANRPETSGPSRRALPAILGLAAVALVAVLLVVALPLRDQRIATASQSPAPTPSHAPDASTVPSPTPIATNADDVTVVDGIAWKRISWDALPDGAILSSVQVLHGRFFAYAVQCARSQSECDSIEREYIPFVSDDGINWTPLAPVTISAAVVKFGYDEGLGYVATGTFVSGPGVAIWHSTDGSSWEWLGGQPGLGEGVCEQQTVQGINASTFYRADNGLIVAGLAYCTSTIDDGAWTSADGHLWTQIDAPPVLDVLAIDDVWVGTNGRDNFDSLNGRDWSVIPDLPAPIDLAQITSGFLAASNNSAGNLSHNVWTSVDGMNWSVQDAPFQTKELDTFSSDGRRAVVLEVPSSEPVPTPVWVSSADGTSWVEHDVPQLVTFPSRQSIIDTGGNSAATLGNRVVALPIDQTMWVADIATPEPAVTPTASTGAAPPETPSTTAVH